MNSPSISAQAPAGVRFEAVVEPLQDAFARLEDFLAGQIQAFEPEVRPLVEYCFGHSGKKLRPIIVFSMAMDGTRSPDDGIVRAAAIVELVHLATLVHDDILDHATVRHRTETVVARYGSHAAVLLGDALFAHALHLAAQFPDTEVCRSVSEATRQVCSGEIAQTLARHSGIPSTEYYYRIIDLKTAELFKVSAHLGGFLSGFAADALAAARDYARHLGIAYQIYDDAADIFADEAVAGKTLGTDLSTGKFTLPILLWLDAQPADRRAAALDRLRNGGDRAALRAELLATGVLPRVGEAFAGQIGLARAALDRIPGHHRPQQLRALLGFVAQAWNKFSIR